MSGSCLISHRFRWFQGKKGALFFPLCTISRLFAFPLFLLLWCVSSVAVQWCPAARSDSSTRMRFRTRYWCCKKKKRWGEGSDAEGWSASAHAPPSPFTCRPSPIPFSWCTARLRSVPHDNQGTVVCFRAGASFRPDEMIDVDLFNYNGRK